MPYRTVWPSVSQGVQVITSLVSPTKLLHLLSNYAGWVFRGDMIFEEKIVRLLCRVSQCDRLKQSIRRKNCRVGIVTPSIAVLRKVFKGKIETAAARSLLWVCCSATLGQPSEFAHRVPESRDLLQPRRVILSRIAPELNLPRNDTQSVNVHGRPIISEIVANLIKRRSCHIVAISHSDTR